ncbi:dihydrofolate reductase family protein [Subtercola sp. RTI3]|uniref:dihydrofolate reductase family protein n=1 Tax=Subtercola sp. RTI3 TaxID=3048639 RepID=UPI002B22FB88|nr:dihydrofolate reductase family protein [Subtercola sp. RTI3]MEA9983991.1 dihydrofolate reductase family protein [Subtercola sp. RTI3]
MTRIVAVEYLSLDGVMEEPGWSGPYFNDEVATFQMNNLFGADALLLGRVTYDGFRAAWPSMEGDEAGFGERMNSLPKYVATTSTSQPEWNATFLRGDIAEAVAALKATADDTLLLNGSADLFRLLSAHNLIDEYRFMIYPVVVGLGKRLFADGAVPIDLKLTSSLITQSGVAILTYVPAD